MVMVVCQIYGMIRQIRGEDQLVDQIELRFRQKLLQLFLLITPGLERVTRGAWPLLDFDFRLILWL